MNPWIELMKPILLRPGIALREPPTLHSRAIKVKGYTARAAAAVVVTDTGIFDRPDVRLIPIIAVEFDA